MLLALCYLLLLLLAPLLLVRLPASLPQTRMVAKSLVAPLPPAEDADHFSLHYVVRPDQTLSDVFRALDLDTDVLFELLTNEEIRYKLEDLQPGDTLAIEPDSAGTILRLLLDRDLAWQMRVDRQDGEYRVAELHRRPKELETCGEIRRSEQSMQADAALAGVPEDIVHQIDTLLNWSVNLALDSRAGDLFVFLYKEGYIDGQWASTGAVTALEYRSADEKRVIRIFRYQLPEADQPEYYNQDGNNIRKAFLRSPLRSNLHVSSPYNPNRVHPELHVIKAHTGVDYLAQVGAQVQATADGKVQFANFHSGYGNLVIIDHANGYQTRYGHLNGFARGVGKGTWVKQGDLLGYVGTTGLSTGPHLHYEFRIDSVHTDPEAVDLPSAPPIPVEEQPLFKALTRTRLAQLQICSRFIADDVTDIVPASIGPTSTAPATP